MTIANLNGATPRMIPLHRSEEDQTCDKLALGEVPALSADAVMIDVSPRTYQYKDGHDVWFVDRRDKAKLRCYRRYRTKEEIGAGAYPISAEYNDGKGTL